MTTFLEAAMKRTVLILTSLVILMAWGGISAYQMQRDYLPPIDNPTLMITVHAQNYQAAQIQAAVAEPIAQSVRKINGLESLETSSFDDGLLMSLYFPLNYDMERAENDTALALDRVPLPAEIDKPVVTRVSTSSFPIMRLSLTSASGQIDENTLRTTLQADIAAELRSVPGVSDVRVTGAGNNGYAVTVRTADLRRAGLTLEDVKKSLGGVHLSGLQGKISNSQVAIPFTASSGAPTGQDLMRLPVQGTGGRTVPLSAVADLSPSIVDLQTISRTDGKPSVVFDVLKTPSSNITEVSDLIHDRIGSISALQSGGVKLDVLLDQGRQVKSSLQGLFKEGLLGCLLSMVSVILFFRNIRSTALIALSLPVCFLATTGLLHAMGISLNLLTVSGLIAAMGRVIDDSIVILDNMYRKADETGEKVNAAIIAEAVREMLPAIVSSTATTVAVYIPIALVGGMISAAFSGFAWSVVIALLTSLLVAMFVVPALYHLWQRGRRHDTAISVEFVSHHVLGWAFRRKRTIIAAFAAILLLAGAGAFLLPVNFLPASKSGQINVQLEFPEGTGLQQMDATVGRMEQALKSDADIATFSSVLGSSFTPQFDDVFDAGGGWIQGGNIANIAVSVKPEADVDAITAKLKQRLAGLSGSAICTVTNQNIAGDDSQLKIDLTGADAVTLDNAARLIRSKLAAVPDLSVMGAADDKETIPRHQLTLDPEAMRRAGVTADEIYRRIQDYLSEGARVEMMTGDDKRIPLVIRTDRLEKAGESSAMADPATDILTLLGRETFTGADGRTVRLDELASLKPVTGQTVIRDRDGSPFSVVTANITSRDIEKVADQAEEIVRQLTLPPAVHYSINGISAQVNQMIVEMGVALSVSVLLVLLILSAAFRSWRAPVTVLACIPFAYIGSVAGMLIWGGEWNLASLVGLLMLSGIVATNGIVLADKIERNLASGMHPKEAIIRGAATRVRPVLVTAVTTVLTLLPLCLSGRADTVVSQTLGIVVVCGMISSTLISLLVIPIVYDWMYADRPLSVMKRKLAVKPAVTQ